MEKRPMHGNKIRMFRTLRGYSQEYMADQLGMQQNSYSRIETGQNKKIAPEILKKIAEILGVTIADITSNEPIIIQNQASNNGTQGIGYIENFYPEQKELYEKFLDAKDKEIERLSKQVESLMKLLEKKK